MPEKSKRRRNNKNKRKNKNNSSDQNKSVSDVIEPCHNQSCSVENDKINRDIENIGGTSKGGVVNSTPFITSIQHNIEIKLDNMSKNINTSILNNVIPSENNDISDNIKNSSNYNLDKGDGNDSRSLDNSIINTVTIDEQHNKTFQDSQVTDKYVVESPDQSLKVKPKLGSSIKSKSLDNDDAPKIVEITEENHQSEGDNTLTVIDSSNILVSDVESDVEWEKTENLCKQQSPELKELATGKLSITTVPLDIAHSDQAKLLTPEEESSLREYLQTLNLSDHSPNVSSVEIKTELEHIINREIKHRLRKKGLADDFFSQKLAPPRTLDVIDEEGSSESSITSRRQSYLSDKKSDNDDLEDDVFENKVSKEKFHAKSINSFGNKNFGRLIPQQCLLVDARIKEPEISEARGDWTVKNVEKMKGAEIVYLTDSSSSTSSLYDLGEERDDSVETDVSVRMITPTIEVTDAENFLTKTFMPKDEIKKVQEINSTLFQHKINDSVTNEASSSNPHEIVVLSTDDIKTNLYVKDINEMELKEDVNKDSTKNINAEQSKNTNKSTSGNKNLQESGNDYDLEMKVLKCELNDAINNLINEVTSNPKTVNVNTKDITFSRQDSSSSVCSSQCTAKYNPNYSSLNDVSNIMHDETCEFDKMTTKELHTVTDTISHVKDVVESVTKIPAQTKLWETARIKHPLALRDLCVRKIATFPYGDKILEELASVSERLQNISVIGSNINKKLNISEFEYCKNTNNQNSKMEKNPCMSNTSSTEMVSLPTKKDIIPPPIQPRNSSLKISQDEHNWIGLPTKTEPVYVCPSPSQKMLMEKTNTVVTKEDASQLVDIDKKLNSHKDKLEYNDNEKQKESEDKNSPATQFKSQTGSRLLALIRDPVITCNINSSMNKYSNKDLDHLPSLDKIKRLHATEISSKKNYDHFNSVKDLSSTFKPIPPPRPRKYSSSFYESDESSDFADNSFRMMRNEKKFFHYSTGNLNKDIENDISSIQNLHRFYTAKRDEKSNQNYPRRPSLPKDLCDQQMEYIRQKEKEVDAEIRRLEEQKINLARQRRGPRAPLISDKEIIKENFTDENNYSISRKRNVTYRTKSPEKENVQSRLSSLFSSSQEEILRDKMYSEYVNQMAERQERKQHKIIKITNTPSTTATKTISKSMSALDILDSKVNNRIEKEFIVKARERWHKLGIKDPETEDEKDENKKNLYKEPKVIEHRIKVIEGDEERDVQKLPSHLQEFVRFTAKEKGQETSSPAVWRPGAPTPPPAPVPSAGSPGAPPPPPPPPVWTPNSASASPLALRKTFRPVHFEETPPSRRKFGSSEHNGCTSGSESEGRLRTSLSAPATGLNTLGTTTSRLPKAQNPTVTLLQKAREGQLPRGSNYLQQERDIARLPRDRASPPKEVNALRREYASEGEERSYHDRGGIRKMADGHRKVDGIGPTTKDGMPVALRSEVKDPSRWYKKMYDTIHKNKYDDDYVTVRYKSRRGQPPQRVTTNKSQYAYFDPRSGYLSEPEGGISRLGSHTWSDAYDSDVTSGVRRRTASAQEDRRDDATSPYLPSNKYSTLASARASQEVYKNQPGKIENYVPGKSSVVDKEAKQWWDEVMDIFDGQLSSTTSLPQPSPKEKKDITSTILSKSNMARALKESGYESDSTLIFRRREDAEAPLSPAERRAAYRDLQAGGEPPLRGFRSPAPPRQETDSAPEPPRRTPHGSYSDTESPRRYVESDVNIHYRCPVRHDPLPLVPERELARQQAEHMKRLYREQRRNKYLQELQDMQSRRHQDNFTPSQKTIVPLNRYDDAEKIIARALYAFNGQTAKELSFRKGELIHVRRQIDANWYEGELHGRIGLFPYNYVEILKGDMEQSPKKPVLVEGRARAKFDFIAQTNLELPLKKGEIVVLSRRIDQNWWEGRNGNKTGIFPDSYVTVLQEPSQNKPEPQPILSTAKPVASPAAHGLINGDKRSMGSHSYTPQQNSPALANAPPATQPLPGYVAKPAQVTLTPSERGYGPPTGAGVDLNNTEPLYVDTNAEAVPYRAMYKYRPQNPDELELNEGDTVYVLEKCDDGWYVGSSQRTGRFGTFPGNYVERI